MGAYPTAAPRVGVAADPLAPTSSRSAGVVRDDAELERSRELLAGAADAASGSVDTAACARALGGLGLAAPSAAVSAADVRRQAERLIYIGPSSLCSDMLTVAESLPTADRTAALRNSARFRLLVNGYHRRAGYWLQQSYLPLLELELLPEPIAEATDFLNRVENGTLEVGDLIRIAQHRRPGNEIRTTENAVYSGSSLFSGKARVFAGQLLLDVGHREHGEALVADAARFPDVEHVCPLLYIGATANGLIEDAVESGVHGRNYSEFLSAHLLLPLIASRDIDELRKANLNELIVALADPALTQMSFAAIRADAKSVVAERYRVVWSAGAGEDRIVPDEENSVDITNLQGQPLLRTLVKHGITRVRLPRGRVGDDACNFANGWQGDMEAAEAGACDSTRAALTIQA